MPDLENIILSVGFFLIMCAIFYLWKYGRKKKALNSQQKFTLETLELAQAQFETFNLKLQGSGQARNGLSAMLHEIDKDGLHMAVNDFVPDEWLARPVEVFFRARREEGPVFYVFASTVRQIKSDYEDSRLILAIPESLRVEKKRHFIRVQPPKEDIRVIGVWPIQPGKKLPRTTQDIGAPLTHYKPGMTREQVQIENISASGLALRFSLNSDGKAPLELAKGSQLICLVVYTEDEADNGTTAFWCTGEIMNCRQTDTKPPALVAGLEFTNWAVLEHGTNEIHWAHSSPSRGVRPILRWVEQIDKKQGEKA